MDTRKSSPHRFRERALSLNPSVFIPLEGRENIGIFSVNGCSLSLKSETSVRAVFQTGLTSVLLEPTILTLGNFTVVLQEFLRLFSTWLTTFQWNGVVDLLLSSSDGIFYPATGRAEQSRKTTGHYTTTGNRESLSIK